MGKAVVHCQQKDIVKSVNFYVTSVNNNKVILGLNFCKQLKLVSIHCGNECDCKKVSLDIINNQFPRGLSVPVNIEQTQSKLSPVDVNTKLQTYNMKSHIMELYPDLLDGVGTIKEAEVKLDVDPNITPIVQPPRKVPHAMIQPLKEESSRMEKLGVIHKLDINKATDWCHNLVLVCKPSGKLRVCLDPRTINQALEFHIHNSCTFQDIASSIGKVKQVSKIDANSGFWTLPIDMTSQLLMIFNSPWVRYCFMKMPFDLNQSQYFFQFYMEIHFEGINSTTNVITDDVMIHEESDEQHDKHLLQVLNVITDDVMIHGESDEQHDKHLIQVLNKCREIGLKLNPDKYQFSQDSVQFYGNTVSKHGLSPDPKRANDIIRMPPSRQSY